MAALIATILIICTSTCVLWHLLKRQLSTKQRRQHLLQRHRKSAEDIQILLQDILSTRGIDSINAKDLDIAEQAWSAIAQEAGVPSGVLRVEDGIADVIGDGPVFGLVNDSVDSLETRLWKMQRRTIMDPKFQKPKFVNTIGDYIEACVRISRE